MSGNNALFIRNLAHCPHSCGRELLPVDEAPMTALVKEEN